MGSESLVAKKSISRITRGLLVATAGLGFLHHVDHVLRADHSGWPFIADVTPFTFSLLAYPILLYALLGPPRHFWIRWMLLAFGTGFTLFAHSVIETPQMQYAMWAYNRSLEPELSNVRNLCGVESPLLGGVAVVVSMALNVLLVTASLSMLRDRFRARSVGTIARP